jgi:hypothetical protein
MIVGTLQQYGIGKSIPDLKVDTDGCDGVSQQFFVFGMYLKCFHGLGLKRKKACRENQQAFCIS